jgi:hypothetical protein
MLDSSIYGYASQQSNSNMCIVNTVVELTSEKIRYYQELYVLYRDYIKHEDELINARISWMINIQSFLIATFGFSYQKKFEVVSLFIDKMRSGRDEKFSHSKLNNFKDIKELENILDRLSETNPSDLIELKIQLFHNSLSRYDFFLLILAFIGIATSVSALFSTNAALSSIDELSIKWSGIIRGLDAKLPEIIGGGNQKANKYGKTLSKCLPYFFLALWGVIFISILVKII